MIHTRNGFGQTLERLSSAATRWTGSTPALTCAFGVIVVWLLTGTLFHYSDTWQLVINTSTTIVTFLMVLIRRSQNKVAGRAVEAERAGGRCRAREQPADRRRGHVGARAQVLMRLPAARRDGQERRRPRTVAFARRGAPAPQSSALARAPTDEAAARRTRPRARRRASCRSFARVLNDGRRRRSRRETARVEAREKVGFPPDVPGSSRTWMNSIGMRNVGRCAALLGPSRRMKRIAEIDERDAVYSCGRDLRRNPAAHRLAADEQRQSRER